jgi:Ca-activated chloride channel family protein
MLWKDPVYLWILIALPLIGLLLSYAYKRRQNSRRAFFSDDLFTKLYSGDWKLAHKIKHFLFFGALLLIIVGLSGPQIGTEVREVKRRGVDVMIALDLSASMNAEDVRPSRLEKAKYEINRLVDRLKGDRVGLIVFTGEAYVQSPLTLDYSALKLFLNIANTDQMPSSGTNFSEAMQTALTAFENLEKEQEKQENANASKAAKVLLIISDGEDHSEGYTNDLSALMDMNVNAYTLGIGTLAGGTIPIYNQRTGALIGYKRDQEGKVVSTQLQNIALQDIARQGNGYYYEIQSGVDGIDGFLARIDELEKGEFSSQEYADFKNQYQWLVGIGLLLLALYVVFPTYKKDSKHTFEHLEDMKV